MKRQKDSNLAIPVHQEFEDVNSVKFDEKVSASVTTIFVLKVKLSKDADKPYQLT